MIVWFLDESCRAQPARHFSHYTSKEEQGGGLHAANKLSLSSCSRTAKPLKVKERSRGCLYLIIFIILIQQKWAGVSSPVDFTGLHMKGNWCQRTFWSSFENRMAN